VVTSSLHTSFTLPGLYRVINGIDVFDPKFNIVSPGADPNVFFPFTKKDQRVESALPEITDLVEGGARPDAVGELKDKSKPLLFAMSRLDRIKNVTGLVEMYAKNDKLREKANLLIAGGFIDPSLSQDEDEVKQIETMHALFKAHDLHDSVRWITMRTDKTQVGELYRFVADRNGAFVQPATFEAFGLTVIEAMATGLPTFATCYGGPLEIIENDISGYHIDPKRPQQTTGVLLDFLDKCESDPENWNRISNGAISRVESRYTWRLYANRMLTLSRIYGFWKYFTNIERAETRRYLELLYGLLYRNIAAQMTEAINGGANHVIGEDRADDPEPIRLAD
jgi:sucrose synthase